MIQVYVLVTFWDENGIHKAGTFTEVKEENFDSFYMQKVDSGEVDAYTKAETDELLDSKQDDLTAGQNIQINNDVISATDTGDTVQVVSLVTAGTQIANIKVNGSSNYVYAPEAEGGPFIIGGAGDLKYFLDGQSYPGQSPFTNPVIDTDLDDAIEAQRPIIIKYSDGLIVLSNIFKDADDNIKGSFVVGSDTNSGGTNTSLLKIVTFQFDKRGNMYVAMYVQDATPSSGGGGGGSSATVYQMYDGYGQRLSFSALGNASLKLSADSGSTYVGLSAITTAFDAGKVVIKDSNNRAIEISIIDTQQNRFYAMVNNGADVSMWRFDTYMSDSFEAHKVQVVN